MHYSFSNMIFHLQDFLVNILGSLVFSILSLVLLSPAFIPILIVKKITKKWNYRLKYLTNALSVSFFCPICATYITIGLI